MEEINNTESHEEKTHSEEQTNTKEETEQGQPLDEVAHLNQQLAEQKDKFLRLFAEFDNYKKRMAKERLELFSTAGKEVILEMLPVADDMERAIKAASTTDDIAVVREGLALIFDKLVKAFEKRGVKAIEAKGQLFDVEKHEAITEIPAPSEELKGKIVDEIEKGYMMHEKIIRFSKVVVGK